MKWIGAADQLPKDSWVFICDDDVRYVHYYISLCVQEAAKITDAEQRKKCIFNTTVFDNLTENVQIFGINLIWGVHGVFVSQEFIQTVNEKFDRTLPQCCLRIDDDVVSVIARDNQYQKVPIPHGLNIGHALLNLQGDALSTSYNKMADRHSCHAKINPTYCDNLLIVVIVLASVLLVLILLALVFIVLHERARRRLKKIKARK
jgi:hypothetical protein